MNKFPVSSPHPNLIMGMNDSDISDSIAKLLQSLQQSEEQLKADQQQLKADQQQLKADQQQFRNFQTFIMKLSRQYEQSDPDYRKNQEPPLKKASGISQP